MSIPLPVRYQLEGISLIPYSGLECVTLAQTPIARPQPSTRFHQPDTFGLQTFFIFLRKGSTLLVHPAQVLAQEDVLPLHATWE